MELWRKALCMHHSRCCGNLLSATAAPSPSPGEASDRGEINCKKVRVRLRISSRDEDVSCGLGLHKDIDCNCTISCQCWQGRTFQVRMTHCYSPSFACWGLRSTTGTQGSNGFFSKTSDATSKSLVRNDSFLWLICKDIPFVTKHRFSESSVLRSNWSKISKYKSYSETSRFWPTYNLCCPKIPPRTDLCSQAGSSRWPRSNYVGSRWDYRGLHWWMAMGKVA